MKKGLVFWFTGLSRAGKTTLADKVRDRLRSRNIITTILDGDDVRNRLHRHLGFSEAEIKENNVLIAGLCETERQQSNVVLAPIISPYAESRAKARVQLAPGFFEIHVSAEISVLEDRDTKGLYSKARNGEMDNLIGYSSGNPYQAPEKPDMAINTDHLQLDEAADLLFDFILSRVLNQNIPETRQDVTPACCLRTIR